MGASAQMASKGSIFIHNCPVIACRVSHRLSMHLYVVCFRVAFIWLGNFNRFLSDRLSKLHRVVCAWSKWGILHARECISERQCLHAFTSAVRQQRRWLVFGKF